MLTGHKPFDDAALIEMLVKDNSDRLTTMSLFRRSDASRDAYRPTRSPEACDLLSDEVAKLTAQNNATLLTLTKAMLEIIHQMETDCVKQTERAKLNMKPIKLPTAREERLRGQLMRYRSEWKLR